MANKPKEFYSEKITITMPKYLIQALRSKSAKTGIQHSRIVQTAVLEYLGIEPGQIVQA